MEQYKLLIIEVNRELKAIGFTKKGDTFYTYKNNNWGLINFQKSKISTREMISFTINMGICSSALRKTVDYYPEKGTKPEIESCHWNARIGSFMKGRPDFWWSISASSLLDNVIKDVLTSIKSIALPAIEERISDESLIRNGWKVITPVLL